MYKDMVELLKSMDNNQQDQLSKKVLFDVKEVQREVYNYEDKLFLIIFQLIRHNLSIISHIDSKIMNFSDDELIDFCEKQKADYYSKITDLYALVQDFYFIDQLYDDYDSLRKQCDVLIYNDNLRLSANSYDYDSKRRLNENLKNRDDIELAISILDGSFIREIQEPINNSKVHKMIL